MSVAMVQFVFLLIEALYLIAWPFETEPPQVPECLERDRGVLKKWLNNMCFRETGTVFRDRQSTSRPTGASRVPSEAL